MAKRKSTAGKDENPSRKRKQQQLMVKGEDLPHDLVMEILARLPPKLLARFRCVSRCLYSSSTDPRFLTKLAIEETRNPENLKMFYFSGRTFSVSKINILENGKILDHSFSDQAAEKFEHPLLFRKRVPCSIGSCNGLLCFVYSDTEFVLLNPLTGDGRKLFRRKWLEGCTVFYNHGFGYDTWNADYKIIRQERKIVENGNDINVMDIFSVKDNRWKSLRLSPPLRIQTGRSPVYVNGVLHWRTRNVKIHDRIVSFHLGDEKFGELMVPYNKCSLSMNISALRGCLCICHVSMTAYSVWLMKEYGVEDSWTNIFTIEFELCNFNIKGFQSFIVNGYLPLWYTMDDGILVMTNGPDCSWGRIVVFDSKEEPKNENVCTFSDPVYERCVPYVASLVSPYCPNSRRTRASQQQRRRITATEL